MPDRFVEDRLFGEIAELPLVASRLVLQQETPFNLFISGYSFPKIDNEVDLFNDIIAAALFEQFSHRLYSLCSHCRCAQSTDIVTPGHCNGTARSKMVSDTGLFKA